MLSTLLNWDRQAFYFINHTLGNPFFDLIMPIIREKLTWIPLYLFIVLYSLIRYKLKGLYIILFLIAAVAISDLISAHLIKILVHRLRPCNDPSMKQLITDRVACGNGYSFVSSHASNHFYNCWIFDGNLWQKMGLGDTCYIHLGFSDLLGTGICGSSLSY